EKKQKTIQDKDSVAFHEAETLALKEMLKTQEKLGNVQLQGITSYMDALKTKHDTEISYHRQEMDTIKERFMADEIALKKRREQHIKFAHPEKILEYDEADYERFSSHLEMLEDDLDAWESSYSLRLAE